MWKAADPNLITAVDFINIVANDNEKEIGSTAADFVRDDFYVDDGLKSIPSVGEAVKLIKDVKEMWGLQLAQVRFQQQRSDPQHTN